MDNTWLGKNLAILGIWCLLAIPKVATAASLNEDRLARKILAIELEMQKVNCHLHLEAANPSFKRARRTWLWDIGNAIPTEGGLIAATVLFWSHDEDKNSLIRLAKNKQNQLYIEVERKHNQVNRASAADTIYPQIVGQAIGGTGSLFELGVDCARSVRIRKMGLDERTVLAKMTALSQEVDALILRLTSLRDSSPEEIKLLKNIKSETLFELMRLEGQAGNISSGQYIEDGISFVRNTVGLIGNSINADALLHSERRFNGDGAILNLIAASLITVRPFMSNAGSYIVKRINKRQAKRFFPEIDPHASENILSSLAKLQQVANFDSSLKERLVLYSEQSAKFQDERDLADFEAKKSKQTTVRRYRESFYGPTKQSQSILGVIVGFENGDNATRDNRLVAAGNTTYMTGQAFNILELLRERVVDEKAHHENATKQMLPEMRLKRHLEQVEKLQEYALQGMQD